MADFSLILDLVKDGLSIVEKGLDYKTTRRNLESTTKDLSPLVDKIDQSMKKMDLPTEHIRKLKKIIASNKKALAKHKVRWWNCVIAPYFQSKLSEEYDSLENFISVPMQMLMFQLLTEILVILSSRDHSLKSQTDSAHKSNYNRTPMLNQNLDDRISHQFTVGLDGQSMKELKHNLLNENDKVLNLYGLPGSGKTTLARKLCLDLQVQGKFRNNIIFETLGSQIKVNEAINKVKDELSKYGVNPVLLILDDVWPDSENIVEQLKHLISPDSRILVTSRAKVTAAYTHFPMELLCDEDAEKLLRHAVQPSKLDFDDPVIRKILLQIVKGCKGIPLALEFIGRKLRGKSIVKFQEVLLEWSRGHSILDTNTELLAHLKNSLQLLVDESMRDHFMDLGLFPEDQRIPVTALIDMWTELYDLDESESLCGMIIIDTLAYMNLAAGVKVTRKVGSVEDCYYNNHFLKQHDLWRELAIHMSREEPLQNRKRLIIEMNGNQRPKGLPQQQQSVDAHTLSLSTDQNITPDWCNIHAPGAVVLVLNLKTTEYTFPEFIKEMENLRVLIVTNFGFHPTQLKNLELLCSLCNLKRIRLQQVSIPCLWELKNLHKLSFYMCEVKKAFEDNSIDLSKAMPNLVDLNIEYCKDLVKLPIGLCNIVSLKNLNISNCHKFKGLPQEIGELENLESLRISYCADFEEMPESITKSKNLKFLDISYCVSLGKLPDNIGELQNLEKFYMTGCPIRELPNSVMYLENLKSVICDEYTNDLWELIKSLPCFSDLHIEKADMDNCLNWLPDFGSRGFFL